jgi:hypothetical protein
LKLTFKTFSLLSKLGERDGIFRGHKHLGVGLSMMSSQWGWGGGSQPMMTSQKVNEGLRPLILVY